MSGYDLGVWCSDQPVTLAYARAFYQNFGSRWISVQDSPAFRAFFRELLAKYPNFGGRGDELEHAYDVPDELLRTYDGDDETIKPVPPPGGWKWSQEEDDRSGWAATVVPSGCAVGLSARWSRAEDVVPAIMDLASKHGLVVYDAQVNKLHVPAKLTGAPIEPRPLLILDIAGKRPAIDVRISLPGKEVVHEKLPSRRAAHARARELARKNHLPLYEVHDPATRGQEQPVSVSLDDPSLPQTIKDQIAAARHNGARDIALARYHSGAFHLIYTTKNGARFESIMPPTQGP